MLRFFTLATMFAAIFPLCNLKAADRLPNVVLIISDDQAWNDYSFMGHEIIKTPRLDQLAKESAVFTRGYVPDSLCRPSLMTMVTGLYPHQHRIAGNDPKKGVNRNEMLTNIKRLPTIPKLLAKQGYVSLQTGKWWEGNHKLGGFTHGMTHGDTTRGGRHGDLGLKISREGMQPIVDFIEDAGDKPFFIWHAPFLPHTPHNPPADLYKKYQAKVDSPHVARYYAMCEWFDQTCGELLDYLEESKHADNTIVLYITDNGWIQQKNSGRYAPRSKRSQYDGGVRTPVMIRWPGKIKPMMDKETLVHSIDLAPTILKACGLKPTAEMSGIDLFPVTEGKKPDRDAIFGAIYAHDQADIENPAASLLYRWCVTADHKLIVPAGEGKTELFAITKDPFEKDDISGDNSDTVAALKKKINAWWTPPGEQSP